LGHAGIHAAAQYGGRGSSFGDTLPRQKLHARQKFHQATPSSSYSASAHFPENTGVARDRGNGMPVAWVMA
jgi:hypothetical protein